MPASALAPNTMLSARFSALNPVRPEPFVPAQDRLVEGLAVHGSISSPRTGTVCFYTNDSNTKAESSAVFYQTRLSSAATHHPAHTALGGSGGSSQQDVGEMKPGTWMCPDSPQTASCPPETPNRPQHMQSPMAEVYRWRCVVGGKPTTKPPGMG